MEYKQFKKYFIYIVMNEAELNIVKDKIENMNKFNQIEILRIYNKHKITLNENKYGIHINLVELPQELQYELHNYIKYVNEQELTLSNIENQKEDFKNTFFN